MKKTKHQRILPLLNHYFVFFLLVAFVITCCMLLFLSIASRTLGITFTGENLNVAARLTFANVVFLSLLFTLFDAVRRRATVTRPVNKIVEAAEKITRGDFTVRIAPMGEIMGADTFNPIIDCFNKMAEELSGIETLRTDFVANVSHELKTPLAVMQNYGTLLQQPELSDEKRMEYAKAVTEASRRLASLIANILKLNKLENQQIFPSLEEFDLGEQLCECLLQFENKWESNSIEIETDIAQDVTLYADRELLSLVWNNLLSNAFKFTGRGGKITLTMTADRERATVKVKDTGCGMTPEVGAHIFEKFYQGDTSHATRGNGLGLALVKRVMDITGGEIGVESVYGKGSTFTVTIGRE